jgi:hypothetical protein
MRFENPEVPVTLDEIKLIESKLSLSLPQKLKEQYLCSNGGSPDPYVYEDTVVASFLPLLSSRGKRTAIDTYEHLVQSQRIVPHHYFPFAVDGGGDYFFVDCASKDGIVFLYRSDNSFDDDAPLVSLGVGVGEFWFRLKPE